MYNNYALKTYQNFPLPNRQEEGGGRPGPASPLAKLLFVQLPRD